MFSIDNTISMWTLEKACRICGRYQLTKYAGLISMMNWGKPGKLWRLERDNGRVSTSSFLNKGVLKLLASYI